MAPHRGQKHQREPKPHSTRDRQLKRKRDVEDIESLKQSILNLDPKSATPPELFSQLPLSRETKAGLEKSHFRTLTPIQAHAIPWILRGKDVLAAAKTGSGKTLAFLIPVLENLLRQRWGPHDGIGAIVLSPTRELSLQIFQVLRDVGCFHGFSAGLLIGGKSFQEEKERLHNMNIIVATPGRLLQHLDQNADLDISNLRMLIFDEADRLLDLGFSQSVDSIVQHLPRERQTLLFSATLSKKVSELVRLSLSDPEFVSIDEESNTPSQLQQSYVIVPVQDKLDTLWSFIRANTKKKILVFMSSAKQVRYVYETFRHLQPGISLLQLHGKLKQNIRVDITTKFSNSQHACLLCTDIGARGLDFPKIDFVVQLDCPISPEEYIHRAGRSARHTSKGHSVLFLDPSEATGMLDALEKKKVRGIEEIKVRQNKKQSTINQRQNMCLKDPAIKYLGQKAFISYVRSVFIQKDKGIFNVKNLDLEAFAASLGLPGAPRVKFIKGEDVKKIKNMPRALAALENDGSDDSEEGNESESKLKEKKEQSVRTKYDRMFDRVNQTVLSKHYGAIIDNREEDSNSDSEDDLMVVKARYDTHGEQPEAIDESLPLHSSDSGSDTYSVGEGSLNHEQPNGTSTVAAKAAVPKSEHSASGKKKIHLSSNPSEPPLIIDSNRRAKLLKSRKALLRYKGSGSHVVFDDDDEDDNRGKEKVFYEDEEAFQARGSAVQQRQQFLEDEREKVKVADDVDRDVARAKRQEKKIKRKEREKEMYTESDQQHDSDDAGVQLLPYEDNVNDGLDSRLEDDEDHDEDGISSKPAEKKKRKWFEDADSGEEDTMAKNKTKRNKRRQRVEDVDQQPQTLEDLEAMAVGLLAR